MTSSFVSVALSRQVRSLSLLLCFSLVSGIQHLASQANTTSTGGVNPAAGATTPQMRGTTNAQRKAAAATAAARRSAGSTTLRRSSLSPGIHSNAIVGQPGGAPLTADQLYFSATYPNYANSPLPNPADTVNCHAPNYCGIRKFVDTLPGLNTANDLGQQIPVAVPDTKTFPGADYYEISLREYHEKMHADLPATQLRGYVQTNNGTNQSTGQNTVSPASIHYLGPLIIAQTNRPVRIKFTNELPTGAGGNLFVPVDKTVMGAGLGFADGSSPYLENRATIHLHGGNTPWISDGTPHEWTIPAGDWGNTVYQRGASLQFVPDMYFVNGVVVPACSATVTTNCSGGTAAQRPSNATNDPGHGSWTLYYTNQQSARLMFYHDHAYGTTRLNVYVGEAGGYLLGDPVEADLVNGTNTTGVFTAAGIPPTPVIPATEIPLLIQDKTFVPPNPASTTVYSVPILENGSGYTLPIIHFAGGCSVEPTAIANVGTMTDPFGQFIYGAITDITLISPGSGCTSDPVVSITDPTGTGAAAFASLATLSQQDPTWDTSLYGGLGNLWYPHVYMTNQWPGNPDGSSINPMGRWDYASWFWPVFTDQYQVRGEVPCPTAYDSTMVCPGFPSVLNPAPATYLASAPGGPAPHQGVGSTASLTPEAFMDTPVVNGTVYPTLTVDPKAYRFRILSIGNDRTLNLSLFVACGTGGYTPMASEICPIPTVAGIAGGTEVGMVPAAPTAGFPVWWPTDGRDGGVPDPAASGPSWILIGNEGGFLAQANVVPPAPINYEYDRRSVTVTNTSSHSLELMPAERADVIVDFSAYAGRTLILYNDAPAPNPAYDTRYDYYTGDPDQTGVGGAPTTLVGFGPNTRTVMQIKVNAGSGTGVNLVNLKAVIPAAFKISQPVPVVPESIYNKAYGQSFPDTYAHLQDQTLTFTPIGATKPVTLPLAFKTIQELFELDYGRMNATLGTELPLTNFNTQTTIPLGYTDPFTEDIYDSADVAGQPVGVTGDGTQIWMVIHNGVDSHAIHFHLYNVQVINRFGWDGTTRVPDPIEYGWKDTVRMNPLEIDFVALRPMSQSLPFPVPDSNRLLDVTLPAGAIDPEMSAFGPTNQATSQVNAVVPMGWEYVWHCHILGHEENDMMRTQVFQVPPNTPISLSVAGGSNGNTLTFTDMSLSETGFEIQRATDSGFTVNVSNLTTPTALAPPSPGWNHPVTFLDSTAVQGQAYLYRVRSSKPDADYWNATLGSGPLPNLTSAWSNTAVIGQPLVITLQPTNQAVTVGSKATFSVTANGAPTLTYQWQVLVGSTWRSFVSGTGTASATMTTNATSTGANGLQFRAVVTAGNGLSVTSNTVTLTVNSPPVITVQPANQTVALGNKATFSVTATGTPTLTYQWQVLVGANWISFGAGTGTTSATMTTNATTASANGLQFRVVVTAGNGLTTTSNTATLTVNSPPVITLQPTNQAVTVGSKATFSVTATGAPILTYQWQVLIGASWVSFGAGIGTTSATMTTNATTASANGLQFRVVVTAGNGLTTTSNTIMLSVH